MPDASTEEMFNVANYLFWGHVSGLKLKFELTDDDLNYLNAAENRKIWRKYHSSPELISLAAYELL